MSHKLLAVVFFTALVFGPFWGLTVGIVGLYLQSRQDQPHPATGGSRYGDHH